MTRTLSTENSNNTKTAWKSFTHTAKLSNLGFQKFGNYQDIEKQWITFSLHRT